MAVITIMGDEKTLKGIVQLNKGRVLKGLIEISPIESSKVVKKEEKGKIQDKEEKKSRKTKEEK